MGPDIQHERREAHELIDRLPDSQLSTVLSFLEEIVSRSSPGRPDEEPVTEEDVRRYHEAREWLAERGGKGIPMEEVLAEFGLEPGDFPLRK
jgi:hypothetical protein